MAVGALHDVTNDWLSSFIACGVLCMAIIVLGLVAAFWLGRFPIGREEHEARLKALDIAARGDIDGGTMVP